MKNTIINIINDWNPINIYPLLEDEYLDETQQILEVFEFSKTIDNLANHIFSIFKESFDKEFDKNIDDCKIIARKILESTY